MRSLLLNLLVCIFRFKVSDREKITFVNVTVQWYFYHELETIEQETVASFDNVKKIIPDEEPVSVTIHGSIPILYEKSVFEVPNLIALNLNDVGLKQIKPGAFGNLPHLKWLSLSGNKLTEIKSDTFADPNLSYLDLSFNSIVLLQPGAFKNFNADIVILDNNKLTELPSGVFKNVTLGILSLNGNFLHTIAPKALSPIGLTRLDLSKNELEEIDPDVFDMQKLISLDLDDNSIKLLRPGDLINLPELSELRLAQNELKEIPDGVFNNTKLTYLNLNDNKIVKIASKAFDGM